MMNKTFLIIGLLMISLNLTQAAKKDLEKATVTKIKNEVVLEKQSQVSPATVNDEVTIGTKVETKSNSLAELQFADKSITRLGSNTIFSFDPKSRELKLDKGTLLLHTPPGNGGATIRTAAVTAAITGTTILLSSTPNGGFMMLMLESHNKGTVDFAGHMTKLKPSQLVVINPGQQGPPKVYEVDLSKVLQSSNLFTGFEGDFASMKEIKNEVSKQQVRMEDGKVDSLGVDLIGLNENGDFIAIDSNILEALKDDLKREQYGDNYFLADYYALSYNATDQNFNSAAQTLSPAVVADGVALIAAKNWHLPQNYMVPTNIDLSAYNYWFFYAENDWNESTVPVSTTSYNFSNGNGKNLVLYASRDFLIGNGSAPQNTQFSTPDGIGSFSILAGRDVFLDRVRFNGGTGGTGYLSIYGGANVTMHHNSFDNFSGAFIGAGNNLAMETKSSMGYTAFFNGLSSGYVSAGGNISLNASGASSTFALPTTFVATAGGSINLKSSPSAIGFVASNPSSGSNYMGLFGQTVTFDNVKINLAGAGARIDAHTGLGQINTSYGTIETGKVNFIGSSNDFTLGSNSFSVNSGNFGSQIGTNILENPASPQAGKINVYKQ
jgi:hypothetical protein